MHFNLLWFFNFLTLTEKSMMQLYIITHADGYAHFNRCASFFLSSLRDKLCIRDFLLLRNDRKLSFNLVHFVVL